MRSATGAYSPTSNSSSCFGTRPPVAGAGATGRRREAHNKPNQYRKTAPPPGVGPYRLGIRPEPHRERPLSDPPADEQDPLTRRPKLEQTAVQVALTERSFHADERRAAWQPKRPAMDVPGERNRVRPRP